MITKIDKMRIKARAVLAWSAVAYLLIWLMPRRLCQWRRIEPAMVWLYGESSLYGYGVTVDELCEWMRPKASQA